MSTSDDTIRAAMRARHKLSDAADVRILTTSVMIKAEESDPYKFTARITTDSLDRQDEVVIPQGGDLTEFYNCGIIAWNHNYDMPVAFPNKEKKAVRGDNFIDCGARFMERPSDLKGEFFPDFARAFVTQACQAGIKPGVSIGFIPTESRLPSKLDREKWGDRVAMVHSKWKLLEFSIAPVQANQDAVVTAIGKGLIKREVAKAVGIVVPEESPVPPVPPKKKIHGSVCIMQRAAPLRSFDVRAEIQDELELQLLKRFGRAYR